MSNLGATDSPPAGESWLQRLLLPGLAFKAAVIGGGYATGREVATFFLPSGPFGGLYSMLLATLIWSLVCAATFLFAYQTRSFDYRTFFQHLLGPFWRVYEIAYLLALIVILAVYAAAAGAVGNSLFGWPEVLGAVLLMVTITLFAFWGNESVEKLFKYVSFVLYGTYIVFAVLVFTRFGHEIAQNFATAGAPGHWVVGGVTYAGYNIIGAIVILPVTRHLVTRKDAVVAGVIAGPLAMLPAVLFFICMLACYPQIQSAPLPSDFLLERLELPWFRILFQLMIFSALLESGTGGVHAINERMANSYAGARGQPMPRSLRLGLSIALLIGSVFVAGQFGLVALIANGFRWLAYLFLLVYVAPLLTKGAVQMLRRSS